MGEGRCGSTCRKDGHTRNSDQFLTPTLSVTFRCKRTCSAPLRGNGRIGKAASKDKRAENKLRARRAPIEVLADGVQQLAQAFDCVFISLLQQAPHATVHDLFIEHAVHKEGTDKSDVSQHAEADFFRLGCKFQRVACVDIGAGIITIGAL